MCTCPVSSRLVLSLLVLSRLVLCDFGRMFRVSLLLCLVCLALSLFVYELCCLLSLGSGVVSRLSCSRVPVFVGCFGCLYCVGVCCEEERRGVCIERVSVCTFKASPCVPAPRPHVVTTCGLCAGTHGDILNVHTWGLSACQTTHHSHSHNEAHDNDDDNDKDTKTHNQPTCGSIL